MAYIQACGCIRVSLCGGCLCAAGILLHVLSRLAMGVQVSVRGYRGGYCWCAPGTPVLYISCMVHK